MESLEIDETEPLLRSAPAPAANRMRVPLILAVSLAAVAGVRVSSRWSPSQTNLSADVSLAMSNGWERLHSRRLADGIVKNLAQVHAPTRLQLSSGKAAMWSVVRNGEPAELLTPDGPASSVEHTFTAVGAHTVVATAAADQPAAAPSTWVAALWGSSSSSSGGGGAAAAPAVHTFAVASKTVRYELRDLSRADREAYFDAVVSYYVIGQDEGEALYGPTYQSSSEILREHLYGAGGKECDHWHDDAGIVTHHVGVTWAFENSLKMINPATAAHYWDYTRDAAADYEWYDSPIFDETWFGSNAPTNADHIVDSGRFAYVPVLQDARGFSAITNPYGLLRSPWNTNPVPFLMRNNETFFDAGDSYSSFPSCSDFSGYVNSSLADVLAALDGALHGPVHLMVGGHWGAKHDWKSFGSHASHADFMLLLAKVLWREGFARTPEVCSKDTPAAECVPSCPASIVTPNGEEMTPELAESILSKVNIFELGHNTVWWSNLFETYGAGADDGDTLTFKSLLEELCRVGYAGEMFTSAAPQDPTFWPLHGNAERFVQYLRVLKAEGTLTGFDETWGYTFSKEIASATGRVCDWSDVGAPPDMPTCSWATCSGHREDDLLPFKYLYPAQGARLVSNGEFYATISPFNEDLPYAYDGISTWKGCTGDSLLVEAGFESLVPGGAHVKDAAAATQTPNSWFSFGGWM